MRGHIRQHHTTPGAKDLQYKADTGTPAGASQPVIIRDTFAWKRVSMIITDASLVQTLQELLEAVEGFLRIWFLVIRRDVRVM
jgi:hypothetical protein